MLHCLCGFWKCLSLIFWSLDRIYFGVSCLFLFLYLLFLVFAGLPRFVVGYPALTGGNSQTLLVQVFLLFPFFLWYSHYVYMIPFVLQGSCIFCERCVVFWVFSFAFEFWKTRLRGPQVRRLFPQLRHFVPVLLITHISFSVHSKNFHLSSQGTSILAYSLLYP